MSDPYRDRRRPNPRKEVRDALKMSGAAQEAQNRQAALNAYRAERLRAIANGAMESALPPVTDNMDLAAANKSLSYQTGGRGNASLARTPLNQTVQQGVDNPPPVGNQRSDSVTQVKKRNPKDIVRPRATGNETGTQMDAAMQANRDFYRPSDQIVRRQPLTEAAQGLAPTPGREALLDSVPSTAAAIAKDNSTRQTAIATAQSGKQAQTPYGTVGEDWQQKVMREFPSIGQAGSQANAAFVDAYKKAQASGQPTDPNAIAKQVMQNITNPKPEAQMPQGIANADIAAPPAIGGPLDQTSFAGVDMPAADWKAPRAVSGAQKAGQAVQSAGRTVANYTVQPIVEAAKMGARGVTGAYNAGKDLWAGITGGEAPTPSQPPQWARDTAPVIAPTAPAPPQFQPQDIVFNDPPSPVYDKVRNRTSVTPPLELAVNAPSFSLSPTPNSSILPATTGTPVPQPPVTAGTAAPGTESVEEKLKKQKAAQNKGV